MFRDGNKKGVKNAKASKNSDQWPKYNPSIMSWAQNHCSRRPVKIEARIQISPFAKTCAVFLLVVICSDLVLAFSKLESHRHNGVLTIFRTSPLDIQYRKSRLRERQNYCCSIVESNALIGNHGERYFEPSSRNSLGSTSHFSIARQATLRMTQNGNDISSTPDDDNDGTEDEIIKSENKFGKRKDTDKIESNPKNGKRNANKKGKRTNNNLDLKANMSTNSAASKSGNFSQLSKKNPGNSINESEESNDQGVSSGSMQNTSSNVPLESSLKDHNTAMLEQMIKRISQLEALVAAQTVEMRKLRQECDDLGAAAAAFTQVVELLRQAGLSTNPSTKKEGNPKKKPTKTTNDDEKVKKGTNKNVDIIKMPNFSRSPEIEYFDDAEIFGTAPNSVMDAADAAGASILAAMLAGKLRMMVDVRDAELSTDPDILVQFIELAILPVAAGLEGLTESGNRVKVVFPTVNKLLEYRKAMALSSPDVIALSVLGFGSVEAKDNLVVVIAPSPDDEENMAQMWELLNPTNPAHKFSQPVVLVNYHMLPLAGPLKDFEVVYHLRLLSVQYMTGNVSPEYVEKVTAEKTGENHEKKSKNATIDFDNLKASSNKSTNLANASMNSSAIPDKDEEDALEAAMTHAHDVGVHQGFTRAMVIRAYPRPWHIFVDTSPDADADFEVAATFDEEPSSEEVNLAIVECLEGSEREDELVAQQMQEALEAGQLNKVSEMLEISMGGVEGDDDDDDDDELENGFFFGCDST